MTLVQEKNDTKFKSLLSEKPYILLSEFTLLLFVLAEEAMSGTGVGNETNTPDELAGLTPEQAEQLRSEWSRELAHVEDEIATLRTVLQSKVCYTSIFKPNINKYSLCIYICLPTQEI